MSNALHSYGSTLSYSLTGVPPYTVISEVLDVTIEETITETKVTHLTSPNRTHEYKPGFIEPGTATFTANYVPGASGNYNVLVGLRGTAGVFWKITDPDGGVSDFQGHISRVAKRTPDDDRITVEASIKLAGNVAYTPS